MNATIKMTRLGQHVAGCKDARRGGALAERQPQQAARQRALQEGFSHPHLQFVPPHADGADVLKSRLLQCVILYRQ